MVEKKRKKSAYFWHFFVTVSGRLLTIYLVYGSLNGSRATASAVPLRGWEMVLWASDI